MQILFMNHSFSRSVSFLLHNNNNDDEDKKQICIGAVLSVQTNVISSSDGIRNNLFCNLS